MEINCRGSIPECEFGDGVSAESDALIILANMRRELRVPRAETAGDALDENIGVGLNEDGHAKLFFRECEGSSRPPSVHSWLHAKYGRRGRFSLSDQHSK